MRDRYTENIIASSEEFENEKNYWLEKLSGDFSMSTLPFHNKHSNQSQSTILQETFQIKGTVFDKIVSISKSSEYAIYLLLLASTKILLSRYTNSYDIVVGMPMFKKTNKGNFVNNLILLRTVIKEGFTFKDFLQEVRKTVLEADEYKNFPFSKLIELLGLEHHTDVVPRYKTIILLENIHEERYLDNIKADTVIQYKLADTYIEVCLKYNSSVFGQDTIKKILKHLINIINISIANPDIKLSELEILSQEEKRQILYDFNDTKREYPKDKTIQELFEEQAARAPDNIALVYKKEELTYAELNRKANQLARILRDKGVRGDSIVGIMVERSLEMIIGILGILKAGGAYLPIDHEYPEERIRFMLEDSGVEILLTQNRFAEKIAFEGDRIDLDNQGLYQGEDSNLEIITQPSNLAYIIYTSGSTGKPKGVMVEHKNVVRLVKNTNYIEFSENDNILQLSNFAFDGSVFDLYGALANGSKLIMIPKDIVLDMNRLAGLIRDQGVTIFFVTTALFNALVDLDIQCLKNVRKILFGGERASIRHVEIMFEYLNQNKMIHVYGPTESTVYATYYCVNEIDSNMQTVSIGRPLSNTKVYIIGKNGTLQPIGAIGELCIAGDGLARGYLNQPELTAAKFVAHPFSPGERMYRTGDLARWLPDGNIEFLGRIDHQVKIRGFRIELGEIESQLLKCDSIQEAVVIAKEDSNGNKYLSAYIVAEKKLTVSEICKDLSQKLPDYMIPAYFIQLEKLPLTPNGKVERKALPELDRSMNTGIDYVAPRNETEARLVEVWHSVFFGTRSIGIHDSFFALGGDSIKALQVSVRLQKYGLKMELKDLFQHPTIGELSSYVKPVTRQVYQGIVEGKTELTPIQRWFFEQKFSEGHHFNQSVMLYCKERFDEAILYKVFDKIVVHHDALRMAYQIGKEGVIQYNKGIQKDTYSMDIIDLQNEGKYKAKIIEIANRIQNSIDLSNGPLMKLALFKTRTDDYLLIVIHHLVIDGVSWRIILDDIATAYGQASKGIEITLPPKTDSYQEWAGKQMEYARGEEIRREIAYWKNIENIDIARLPRDYQIQTNQLKDSRNLTLSLEAEETEKLLKQANQAYHTEINDILLTALGMTVREWSGESKILINLEGHGREEIIEGIRISRTVGWFTTAYPVVLDMTKKAGDLSYQIKNVKESIRRIPNKGIGYGILKYLTPNELNGQLKFSMRPEISFNYLGQFDQDVATGIFCISSLEGGESISKNNERQYTLDINGMVTEGELVLSVNYNINEYDQNTVTKFIDSYKNNLLNIINHCLQKKTIEFTPHDYGDNNLSLEELENITGLIKNQPVNAIVAKE